MLFVELATYVDLAGREGGHGLDLRQTSPHRAPDRAVSPVLSRWLRVQVLLGRGASRTPTRGDGSRQDATARDRPTSSFVGSFGLSSRARARLSPTIVRPGSRGRARDSVQPVPKCGTPSLPRARGGPSAGVESVARATVGTRSAVRCPTITYTTRPTLASRRKRRALLNAGAVTLRAAV